MLNPHFDHDRTIWRDEYSGLYRPVDYSQQFDQEWRLFLEKQPGFYQHTGVEIDDDWIEDRIFDLTGMEGYLHKKDAAERPRGPHSSDRNVGGRQLLDLRFAVDHFKGKRCLDAACGAGRWTKTLLALGARVKSIDVSEHGLKSVRRFNDDVERLDIFDLRSRTDLHEAFDFTLCWGVVMHTHDPRLAFENIARTARKGGGCYTMVYAPTLHNSPAILAQRRYYHQNLSTFEEKLAYVYAIADRRENAINYLDMLNTFYNWVVEEETIHNWYRTNGFVDVITLNASEKNPCAYHVFGRKRSYDPPMRDDRGKIIPRKAAFDQTAVMPLQKPFQREIGHAWMAALIEFVSDADDADHPYRSRLVLLEDGSPRWARHMLHDEIRTIGKGAYSHWRDVLYFSTSDNTDPNTNGRNYQIAFAESE